MIIIKLYYDTTNSATYPQIGTPTWSRISNLITFPQIRSRMDETGVCVGVIRDFEGALKDTWDAREFTRMEVRDEDDNVIFRGYLTGKKYETNQCTLTISGISKALQWSPLNKNYILAEGYVSDNPAGGDNEHLGLVNDDDERTAFNWEADYWSTDRDVAILIRDNTSATLTKDYTCTGLNDNGTGENEAGDHTDLATASDGNVYVIEEVNENTWNCVVDLTVEGDNISDVNTIQYIDVDYKFVARMIDYSGGLIRLEINKNGSWQSVVSVSCTNWGGAGFTDKSAQGTKRFTVDLTDYLVNDAGNYDAILGMRFKFYGDYITGNGTARLTADYINVTIGYNTDNITPIMEQIDNNGDSYVAVTGMDWTHSGVSDGGDEDGDVFKIGENTTQILSDISNACNINIRVLSTGTKYIAQWFKGTFGLEILKKICLLEGWHWREDYSVDIFGEIVISHLDDCEDSGVDITQADYGHDWSYDDDPEFFSTVIVYGAAAYRVEWTAHDPDITSPKVKVIYEETITTNAEAKDVADAQLAEWKVKHPSIKLSLKGVNADIKIGTEITLTMVRPTVAEANYPIRMIERERLGHGEIKTTIYAGMGHTTVEEKLANRMNAIMYLAQKAHTDRLISTPLGIGVNTYSWADIAGAEPAVLAIINAELVDGQSIDNAIDALITAHAGDDDAHHAKYTDAEVQALSINNLSEDASPELGADLDVVNYDLERAGTVYHADTTRWLTRISNTGYDGGTLYDIGLYWDTTTNSLYVRGYTNLYLGVNADVDTILITNGVVTVNGNIAVTGTVDGVDIAAHAGDDDAHHAKYTNAEVQALSINSVEEDTTPKLGGTLDADGHDIIGLGNLQDYIFYGYYPATYNFRDEDVGASGTDIGFVDAYSGVSCLAQIITEFGGHRKVLEITDTNAAGYPSITHTFSSAQAFGTIEFFIASDDPTRIFQFAFGGAGGIAFYFQMALDKFRYWDGGWHDVGLAAIANTLYHVRIDFECGAGGYAGLAADDWHVYIDGIHYGDYNFGVNNDTLTYVLITGDNANQGYTHYLDAWGESWDADYAIGDNLWDGTVPTFPLEDLDDVDVASPTEGDILVFDGSNWVVGVIKTLNATQRTTTSATYVKLKEILIQVSGTLTFYWQTKTSSIDYLDGYTRLYINGVATGAEKQCGFIYEDKSEEVEVSAGDLVQIYGKRDSDGGTLYAQGFYVETLGNINWDY